MDARLEALDDQIEALEHAIDANVGIKSITIMEEVDELKIGRIVLRTRVSAGEKQNDRFTETMERFNSLLQKGFKKVADTLENIDLEKVGENVRRPPQQGGKTVGGGLAADAAEAVQA